MPATNPNFITSPPDLSRCERALFALLVIEPHRVMTKDQILCACPSIGSIRRLDTTAARLRARLSSFDGRRSPVNIWGVGYRLEDPQS